MPKAKTPVKKSTVAATSLPWIEQEPDAWPGARTHDPNVNLIQLGLQRLWEVVLRKLDGEEPNRTYLVVAGNSNIILKTIPAGWEMQALKDFGCCNVFIPRAA